MKRILLIISLFATLSAGAQSYSGDRIIARSAFYLKNYWFVGVATDSASFDRTDYIPTARGVKNYIASLSLAGGGVTIYDIQTAAAGVTAFTFSNVPSAYADYTIAVNGVLMRPGIDFTRSNNDITIPTITAGEYVEYRRIK